MEVLSFRFRLSCLRFRVSGLVVVFFVCLFVCLMVSSFYCFFIFIFVSISEQHLIILLTQIATLNGHTQRVLYLAVSPDGEVRDNWQVNYSGGGVSFPTFFLHFSFCTMKFGQSRIAYHRMWMPFVCVAMADFAITHLGCKNQGGCGL